MPTASRGVSLSRARCERGAPVIALSFPGASFPTFFSAAPRQNLRRAHPYARRMIRTLRGSSNAVKSAESSLRVTVHSHTRGQSSD
jgi:hypothetical protein